MPPRRIEQLAALSPAVRAELLELLDEFSRPLTPREIEHALAPFMTRRERMLPALQHLELVAIVPIGAAGSTEEAGAKDDARPHQRRDRR